MLSSNFPRWRVLDHPPEPVIGPATSGRTRWRMKTFGERASITESYTMLELYYTPGACSMASHIVLEETGEKYTPTKVDLAGGEQRTEAYLKINPQGRVPVLRLDDGFPLAENTAILPYLGKRFGLWPKDDMAEVKALS